MPGAELAASTADAVRGADLVLSLTTAAAARAAATAAAPALRPGAVYADLNTGSAQLKRDVAATVEDAGALFADVAVMAPVPGRGLRTPLLASGSGAERLAELLAAARRAGRGAGGRSRERPPRESCSARSS